MYVYNLKTFEYGIHNRCFFIIEDEWARPDFNIMCQLYVGEGLGNDNIRQPIMFFKVFCDHFADNTKI